MMDSSNPLETCNNFQDINRRGKNDPYSQTYNPGWRNHPNFSYKNTQNQFGQGSSKPPLPPTYQAPQSSRLESTLDNFMKVQANFNEKFEKLFVKNDEELRRIEGDLRKRDDEFRREFRELHNKFDSLSSHLSHNSRQPGKFPSQPEMNPSNEHCNAVVLRSGKRLDEPREEEDEKKEKKEEKKKEKEEKKEEEEEPKYVPPPPYQPPVPFPQRLAQTKLDMQFGKFLEVLKKLYINVPFTDALEQMPSYRKFLKDILSKKRKIDDWATVALTEECSAIIQSKLPPKLKDPGSFSIPCMIGKTSVDRALCDLGASVSLMPLSMVEKFGLGEPKPTNITLQLADRSVKYAWGILEDVPVKVGNLYIPVDFVVLDMDEDSKVPIILGRPFLATAGAIIDVRMGKLTFNVGEEKVEFDISNPVASPISSSDSCCRLDSLVKSDKGKSPCISGAEPAVKDAAVTFGTSPPKSSSEKPKPKAKVSKEDKSPKVKVKSQSPIPIYCCNSLTPPPERKNLLCSSDDTGNAELVLADFQITLDQIKRDQVTQKFALEKLLLINQATEGRVKKMEEMLRKWKQVFVAGGGSKGVAKLPSHEPP